MNKIFSLRDKIAVVSGGYGHLGSAMVECLLEAEAKVVVAGRDQDKFDVRFGYCVNEQLSFVQMDILSTDSVVRAFKEVIATHGKIDILVNNAHSTMGNDPEQMSDEDWAYTLDGVLGSVHRCIREVIPYMKVACAGKIINISSMYGLVSPDFRIYDGDSCAPYRNPPHYGAAKAGIIQLTKYYAVYLGEFNIQVNSVSPGPFPKQNFQNESPEFINRLKLKTPLNRIGEPKDIKGVIALLSSSASDFITGQNIVVDGGWTIW